MDAARAIEKTRCSSHNRRSKMNATKNTIVLPPPTASIKDHLTPFLKAKDIAEKGVTKITLLGATRESTSQFGKGIDVGCKMGTQQFTWTIKYDSGNYSRLFNRFGSDAENWKGTVKVERKEYMGHDYVAVVD
jgi:hypothetical protein